MNIIYQVRNVVTMNPSRPFATHIAVRSDRIIGIGTLEQLTGWGEYRLDRTFADKILMPGLVDGHSHVAEGVQWRFVYCGYFDRTYPDGRLWPGVKSIEEVIARLASANAKLSGQGQPLTGWALDPIYFQNRRMTRKDLDRVSSTRPIGIMHASGPEQSRFGVVTGIGGHTKLADKGCARRSGPGSHERNTVLLGCSWRPRRMWTAD